MKEIKLTQGMFALVDDEDFDLLVKSKWSVHQNSSGSTFYARSGTKKFMHRIVINAPSDMQVDHINGDGLDNRKCNLRIVTATENAINKKTQKSNTSGYPGIHKHTKNKTWIARITFSGKRIHLGSFSSIEEAIEVRKKAEDQYYGEYSRRRSLEISEPLSA